jgi:adenylosuccinate lyase
MRAWKGDGAFRANVAADADVAAKLTPKRLDELFDLDRALRHAPEIVERALAG